MADLSLDFREQSLGTPAYGDLLVINGDLVLTSDVDPNGTDPVLQSVAQRLRFYLGEWFLNTGTGVPWHQQILVKGTDQAQIDAVLKDTILGTTGVVALTSYSSTADPAKRSYTVTFSVKTAAGNTVRATVPVATGTP